MHDIIIILPFVIIIVIVTIRTVIRLIILILFRIVIIYHLCININVIFLNVFGMSIVIIVSLIVVLALLWKLLLLRMLLSDIGNNNCHNKRWNQLWWWNYRGVRRCNFRYCFLSLALLSILVLFCRRCHHLCYCSSFSAWILLLCSVHNLVALLLAFA